MKKNVLNPVRWLGILGVFATLFTACCKDIDDQMPWFVDKSANSRWHTSKP